MWRKQGGGQTRPEAGQGVVLTDADLDAARQGDRDAVSSIYIAYVPALTRYFVSNTGDRYAAEDLVSKVFEQAIRSLPAFRGPVEALGGWLFQIARHDLLDFRRTERRRRTESLDDRLEEVTRAEVTYDPQDLAANRVDGNRAIAMLRCLSPDQQQVLTLRLVAGLSTVEVARAMGKTVGAVKALQHRALAALARMNAGTGDPGPPAGSTNGTAPGRGHRSMTNMHVQEHPYPSGTHRRLAGEETER